MDDPRTLPPTYHCPVCNVANDVPGPCCSDCMAVWLGIPEMNVDDPFDDFDYFPDGHGEP